MDRLEAKLWMELHGWSSLSAGLDVSDRSMHSRRRHVREEASDIVADDDLNEITGFHMSNFDK